MSTKRMRDTYMKIFANFVIIKLWFKTISSRLKMWDRFFTPLFIFILGEYRCSDQRLKGSFWYQFSFLVEFTTWKKYIYVYFPLKAECNVPHNAIIGRPGCRKDYLKIFLRFIVQFRDILIIVCKQWVDRKGFW